MIKTLSSLNKTEHGTNFTGRTTGNINKHQQFIRGSALETFSNIVRYGKRRPFYLIPKAVT